MVLCWQVTTAIVTKWFKATNFGLYWTCHWLCDIKLPILYNYGQLIGRTMKLVLHWSRHKRAGSLVVLQPTYWLYQVRTLVTHLPTSWIGHKFSTKVADQHHDQLIPCDDSASDELWKYQSGHDAWSFARAMNFIGADVSNYHRNRRSCHLGLLILAFRISWTVKYQPCHFMWSFTRSMNFIGTEASNCHRNGWSRHLRWTLWKWHSACDELWNIKQATLCGFLLEQWTLLAQRPSAAIEIDDPTILNGLLEAALIFDLEHLLFVRPLYMDFHFWGIKQQITLFIVLQQTGSQTMTISAVMGLNKTVSSWDIPGDINILTSLL